MMLWVKNDYLCGMMRDFEASGIRVGRFNTLQVVKLVNFGCYLDGGPDGEILMPAKYMPQGLAVGDDVRVFVYYDSEYRLVATTETPLAQVGQLACLMVKQVSGPGAFLDWGLTKDLLVPRGEQRDAMVAGRSYVVYVFQDEASGRIAATQKFARFLDNVMPRYEEGDEAHAIVTDLTPLGYKVAVDNLFTGLIYESDVYKPLAVGDSLKVYVKKVREDDKLDVSPNPIGFAKSFDVADRVVEMLRNSGGELAVGDKSNPELIKNLFECSKKSFKMAIGNLYKKGVIEITPRGIKLIEPKGGNSSRRK